MKLIVENLSCGYGKVPIQRALDFSLSSGEVCCILGPNGCGKTTVFKTLLGLIRPLSGRIRIDGKDASKLSTAQRSRYMGYVAQAHRPAFPTRVEDAVLLGLIGQKGLMGKPRKEDMLRANQALKDMGISHLRDKLYTDISGGELQLTMIARALVQNPQMLVLDEPTASLDYGNVVRVISKVKQLAQRGYGIIMTTHDPSHAFMMDSNVLLLQPDKPMIYGPAVNVITEANLKDAYGIDTRVVEFVNRKGHITRMCAPEV